MSIPFVRGFKRPSSRDQIEAIGDLDTEPLSQLKWFRPRSPFEAIPQPQDSNDWLAQYCEEGQTYVEFLDDNPWLSSTKVSGYLDEFQPKRSCLKTKYPQGRIYLLQLGQCQSPIAPQGQDLTEFASAYLQVPVEYLGTLELVRRTALDWFLQVPDRIITLLKGSSGNRKRSSRLAEIKLKFRQEGDRVQWHCPKLLRDLKRFLPKDALAMISVTMFDLYEGNPDLFVAGLASGNDRVAVFSFARYDPALIFSSEFWHEIKESGPTSTNIEWRKHLVLVRSLKLIVHELGHLLGFDHCIHFACCMNGSGHLEEDFRQPMLLCPMCLRKLKTLCDINIPERYRSLRSLFNKHQMKAECALIEQLLA
ncbi:archaemetzincin-2-like isoform X2 [Tigriopus californicus]|uniref:archaemetzincin-2-like isoform X2 n=1 Tax=Tigriopus californicus TaxID=6832 RepID=UPI0027DA5FE7|nr:archaemetzincin-2-like isoform X2 [Tigriopus californicus]